jgi:cytochrome c biogenesis protein CcmG/thiol:disulfide interchange protein DsbE
VGLVVPPCRDEAPALAAAARAYGDRVAFVGVDYQDRAGSAGAFKDDFGLGFPSVEDPGGEIARSLRMVGIPVTVIFDRDGAEVFPGWGR